MSLEIYGHRLANTSTGWFRSFIGQNHRDTGLMESVTACGFIQYRYADKLRLTWTLKTTEYFRYVELYRIKNNMKPMMKLLKESREFQVDFDMLRVQILKDFKTDIINKLNGNNKQSR